MGMKPFGTTPSIARLTPAEMRVSVDRDLVPIIDGYLHQLSRGQLHARVTRLEGECGSVRIWLHDGGVLVRSSELLVSIIVSEIYMAKDMTDFNPVGFRKWQVTVTTKRSE